MWLKLYSNYRACRFCEFSGLHDCAILYALCISKHCSKMDCIL